MLVPELLWCCHSSWDSRLATMGMELCQELAEINSHGKRCLCWFSMPLPPSVFAGQQW